MEALTLATCTLVAATITEFEFFSSYRASVAQKSTRGDDYSPPGTRLIRRNRYRLRARALNKYLPRKNSIASFSSFLFEYFSHLRLTVRAARMVHRRSGHMLRMHFVQCIMLLTVFAGRILFPCLRTRSNFTLSY